MSLLQEILPEKLFCILIYPSFHKLWLKVVSIMTRLTLSSVSCIFFPKLFKNTQKTFYPHHFSVQPSNYPSVEIYRDELYTSMVCLQCNNIISQPETIFLHSIFANHNSYYFNTRISYYYFEINTCKKLNSNK